MSAEARNQEEIVQQLWFETRLIFIYQERATFKTVLASSLRVSPLITHDCRVWKIDVILIWKCENLIWINSHTFKDKELGLEWGKGLKIKWQTRWFKVIKSLIEGNEKGLYITGFYKILWFDSWSPVQLCFDLEKNFQISKKQHVTYEKLFWWWFFDRESFPIA